MSQLGKEATALAKLVAHKKFQQARAAHDAPLPPQKMGPKNKDSDAVKAGAQAAALE